MNGFNSLFLFFQSFLSPFEYEKIFIKEISQIFVCFKLGRSEDEIPYNEELVKTAFPYGMARFIFRENGDISGSREFYQLYVIALSEATPVVLREVEDIYR